MLDLSKGSRIDLKKEDGSPLTKVTIGLGWDTGLDLDACAILLNKENKVKNDNDYVYFKQLTSSCGSVVHSGDNLTGEGDGDDETITINLPNVPTDIETIKICIVVYTSGSKFGMVNNAYARVLDNISNDEVMRYDLSEDFSDKTVAVVCDIYRKDNSWKIKCLGEGFNTNFEGLFEQYK